MAKRGRPKLLKAERRAHNLNLRLTGDEAKAIDAAADAQGVGRSEWARGVILTALGRPKSPAPQSGE